LKFELFEKNGQVSRSYNDTKYLGHSVYTVTQDMETCTGLLSPNYFFRKNR